LLVRAKGRTGKRKEAAKARIVDFFLQNSEYSRKARIAWAMGAFKD
jgi:hypothetical protein